MKFVRNEGSKKISIAVLNKKINKYGCWCINTEDFESVTDFTLLVTAIFEEFAQKNNIDKKYTGFNLAEIAFTTDISENKCCEYTAIIENIWEKIKTNKGYSKMKSILLSIKPEWLAKILNGEKTIEVRKLFPKDYVGWVYLYCSKGNKKDWHLIEVVNPDTGWEGYEYDYYIGSKGYLDWCLEGKVVARFWCDKVTEMIVGEDCCGDAEIEEGCDLIDQTCLTEIEIIKYLGGIGKNGFAIHISKLEIFDEPKELSEFYTTKLDEDLTKRFDNSIQLENGTWVKRITKAPQSFMYIEGK